MNNFPDQTTVVAAFGELMMRLHCPDGKRFSQANSFDVLYSGAEANVCALLSRLGIATRFITRLPANDLAGAALDFLKASGINTSHILWGGERMGIYFTEDGNMIRPSRVHYDRKHSSFAGTTKGMIQWNKVLKGAGWFHWSGICPAVSPSVAEVCQEAMDAARQKGLIVSADFNYRSKLWDYGKHPSQIMPGLLSACDVVIGDVDGAAVYFGIETKNELSEEERFKFCSKKLQVKLPAMKILAMSFRGTNAHQQLTYRGALMMGKQFYYSPSYAIPQVTDRLGSGDAFTAGLIYGLLQHSKPQETIDFATACGVLKHSIAGDFAYLNKEEINQFIQTGPVNRVIR